MEAEGNEKPFENPTNGNAKEIEIVIHCCAIFDLVSRLQPHTTFMEAGGGQGRRRV
jgi:hypothetical protein